MAKESMDMGTQTRRDDIEKLDRGVQYSWHYSDSEEEGEGP